MTTAKKFLTVKYGRVSNLGNYETERLEVEVAVDGDHTKADAINALAQAKAWVNAALGIDETLTPEQIARLEKSIERSKRRNAIRGGL